MTGCGFCALSRAFSSEASTGSRQENASEQKNPDTEHGDARRTHSVRNAGWNLTAALRECEVNE
jgi:hypothetical protein